MASSKTCLDPNGKWNTSKLHAAGFRDGAIVRVGMLNFLTYDECEVHPGPKLNIILGPNGTGKSTITHAMCLACGGAPRTLGRSDDLKQFIKHGKEGQGTYVEVDVFRAQVGDVITIRRTMNSENAQSKWMLNKNTSTQTVVKKIMAELNVDMDNLCSFMPQDRVGQFTMKTPQEIMVNSLQAIKTQDGSKTLHDVQLELANVETAKREKQRQLESKKKTKETLEGQLAQMQKEVDRLNERLNMEKKHEMYQVKLIVKEFEIATELVNEKQEEVNRLDTELAQAQEAIQPLEQKEREMKRHLQKFTNSKESIHEKHSAAVLELGKLKNKVEELDVDIEKASGEIFSIEQQRRQNQQKLAQHIANIQRYEEDHKKATDSIPEVQARVKEVNDEIGRHQQHVYALEEESQNAQAEITSLNDSIAGCNLQMRNFRDPAQIFKQRMGSYRFSREVVTAMERTEKNRHKFTAEVYGPVAMYMNVEDPAVAMILEKAIPANKLFGFVATNEADAQVLKSCFQGLKVDVYTMKNRVTQPRPYSAEKLQQLQEIPGLQGYVSEGFQCPDLIRCFLDTFCYIQNVMWSRVADENGVPGMDSLSGLLSDRVKLAKFYCHIAGAPGRGGNNQLNIVELSTKKSIYASNLPGSVSRDVLTSKSWLGRAEEDNRQERVELEKRVAGMKEQIASLNSQVNEKRQGKQQANREVQKMRDQRVHLEKCLTLPDQLMRKLTGENKKKKDAEALLSGDLDVIKQKKTEAYERLVQRLMDTMEKLVQVSEKCVDFGIDIAVAEQRRRTAHVKARQASEQLRDAVAGLKDLTERLRAAKRDKETAQKDSDEKEKAMSDKADELGGEEAFETYYMEVLANCKEEDVQEILNQIVYLEQELGATIENEKLMERYEKAQTELAEVTADVDSMQSVFDTHEEDLRKQSEEWLKQVTKVAEKLNRYFSQFMAEMQFKGEVQFAKVGTIDQYEFRMRVSFTDKDGLVDLSGQRHSGGERAVSTIMFLMALQQMMCVPFRVVDEINQGMDERNERLVFDRIVKSCCAENVPQYFLVSPKLLQGLRAMQDDNITVLIVFNGPGIVNPWQMSDVNTDYLAPDEGVTRGQSPQSTQKRQRTGLGTRALDENTANAGNRRSTAVKRSPSSNISASIADATTPGTAGGSGSNKRRVITIDDD